MCEFHCFNLHTFFLVVLRFWRQRLWPRLSLFSSIMYTIKCNWQTFDDDNGHTFKTWTMVRIWNLCFNHTSGFWSKYFIILPISSSDNKIHYFINGFFKMEDDGYYTMETLYFYINLIQSIRLVVNSIKMYQLKENS